MSNDNFNDMVNEIKNHKSKEDAQDFLMKKLNKDQTQKLKNVLSDKKALEEMLSTPQAQQLLKKFMGDKNG